MSRVPSSLSGRVLAAAALVAALIAACGGGSSASLPVASPALPVASGGVPGPGTGHLTILAAASLRDVLGKAVAGYEAAHPGADLVLSTGSSAALAAQIEQGAPADILLSADAKTAQGLVDRGFAAGPIVPFARNTLAVVVPLGADAAIRTPADLARPGLRIVAAGEAVPITGYARRLVANLATLPGYPADFAARYEANVVSREDDVRSVLAKVELGEADAGIVYATDAASSGRVRTLAVPPAANVTTMYAAVVPSDASDPAGARAFLDWLTAPEGRSILATAGFLPPAP